jgi:hypothetical protein
VKFNRKLLLFALLLVFVIHIPKAKAFSIARHQQITELAYAYIKAVASCSARDARYDGEGYRPESLKQCLETCESIEPPITSAGTCSCIDEKCVAYCSKPNAGGVCYPNSGCSQSYPPHASPGLDAFSCIDYCVEEGVGQSCFETQPETCRRPNLDPYTGTIKDAYYWATPNNDSSIGAPIVKPEEAYSFNKIIQRELCSSLCLQENSRRWLTEGEWSLECRRTASVIASGALTAIDAIWAVDFLENLKDSICTRADYSYRDFGKTCTKDPYNRQGKIRAFKEAVRAWGDGGQVIIDPGLVRVGPVLENASTGKALIDKASINKDFTGTILGFNAAMGDKLNDAYAHYQWSPLIGDVWKSFKKYGVIVPGTGLGAVAAGASGVILCAVSCPITMFFGKCGDCFKGTYNTARDILEDGVVHMDEVDEDKGLFSMESSPTFDLFGLMGRQDVTSLHHFMNSSSHYDDKDGIRIFTGVGGVSVMPPGLLPAVAELLVDFRLDYRKSARPLNNYQVFSPATDGMQSSHYKAPSYFTGQSILYLVFSPEDNLAYYWWHKWLYGRTLAKDPTEAPYGLLPLGVTLHALQDLTLFHHLNGLLLAGHSDFESLVDNSFMIWPDAESPSAGLPPAGVQGNRLLVDAEKEAAFFGRVNGFINEIQKNVLEPNGGLLHVRRLAHFLRERVLADGGCDLGMSFPSVWDYECSDRHIKEIVIPLAVAVSVVVLKEAASLDVNVELQTIMCPYKDLVPSLESFEHMGPVPPLEGDQTVSVTSSTLQLATNSDDIDPESMGLGFASAQPRAQEAARKYFAGESTGEELLQVVFEEKARGDAVLAGLSEPYGMALRASGRAKLAEARAVGSFLEKGSTPGFNRDLACAQLENPNMGLSSNETKEIEATCHEQADSDGDGVIDMLDACITPADLLAKGYQVGPDGCVFNHEETLLPQWQPPVVGAVKVNP